MSKGATRTNKSVALKGLPPNVQTIPFDFVLPIPATGLTFATKAVAKVPKGNWALLTAVSNVIIQDVQGSGLAANFTGAYGFGTDFLTNTTLTLRKRDIVGLTGAGVTYLAAAGITPKTRGTIALTADAALDANGIVQNGNPILYDNTAGALNMNFNMTITTLAAAIVRVRGQLNLIHAILGDG